MLVHRRAWEYSGSWGNALENQGDRYMRSKLQPWSCGELSGKMVVKHLNGRKSGCNVAINDGDFIKESVNWKETCQLHRTGWIPHCVINVWSLPTTWQFLCLYIFWPISAKSFSVSSWRGPAVRDTLDWWSPTMAVNMHRWDDDVEFWLHVSLNHRFCSVLMLSHPFFLWFLYFWFVSCGITIKRRLLPDCLTHRSLLIVSGRW